MSEETPIQQYQKVEIEICAMCRIPVEYCAFGPKASKCKNAKAPTTTEQPKEGETPVENEQKEEMKEEKPQEEKKQTKGKNDNKKIIIEKAKKNKKFTITKIVGVKQFGLKQQDVSKFMAKKFSVGANIDKTQGIDCINVQGDYVTEIANLMVEHFKVDRDDLDVKA